LKKRIILPALVLGLVATGAIVSLATVASAQACGKNKSGTVSAQTKAQHEATEQTRLNTNLDKAVTAGVITADQKQKIIDELATLKNETATKRGQKQTEFATWLKNSGIDATKLSKYIGYPLGRHFQNKK
jgi:hypothetical protein